MRKKFENNKTNLLDIPLGETNFLGIGHSRCRIRRYSRADQTSIWRINPNVVSQETIAVQTLRHEKHSSRPLEWKCLQKISSPHEKRNFQHNAQTAPPLVTIQLKHSWNHPPVISERNPKIRIARNLYESLRLSTDYERKKTILTKLPPIWTLVVRIHKHWVQKWCIDERITD